MAQRRVPPTDYTGRIREDMQKQHAAAMKEREGQIATAVPVQVEPSDVVVEVAHIPQVVMTEEGDVTYVEPEMVTIRVNSTIEQMTFGAGNHFNFEEGGQYRVPKPLADHLEELGYVWH